MDANALKDASGAALDELGAAANIERVTTAGGHGFDETDESYRRRLHASVAGAAAAGAESQPATSGPWPVVSAEAALAEEPNEGPTVVLDDGSVVRGKAAEEILSLRDQLASAATEIHSLNAELEDLVEKSKTGAEAEAEAAAPAPKVKEEAQPQETGDATPSAETAGDAPAEVREGNVGGDGASAEPAQQQ
jgi:hypothetical protein